METPSVIAYLGQVSCDYQSTMVTNAFSLYLTTLEGTLFNLKKWNKEDIAGRLCIHPKNVQNIYVYRHKNLIMIFALRLLYKLYNRLHPPSYYSIRLKVSHLAFSSLLTKCLDDMFLNKYMFEEQMHLNFENSVSHYFINFFILCDIYLVHVCEKPYYSATCFTCLQWHFLFSHITMICCKVQACYTFYLY